MSYAAILKDLKKHVKPDELGVTVHGIRETRSKDLLVELKCSKGGRGRLDTALKEVIDASGTARHLIPRIEVEIADIEPSIEAEDVEDALRGFFDHASELELKVSLTKRTYRRNRKAYVLLEEARALKLLKATHIKIGWVFCRVRQKVKVNRCYRCLGFGHMAVNCTYRIWPWSLKLTQFRGHGLVGKLGSFEFSGYCFGRVPHNVRKCILYLPWT